MAGVLSVGLLALVSVANALPQGSTTGSSCLQLGNNTEQGAYTITCGTDRIGGDLSNAQSSSFSGCIPLCDALPNCVGFTYVMNSGFCYFKSSLTATSTDPNVDVAVKPVPSSSSSSVPASSTGTATSTSIAPSATATGSCAAVGSGNVVDGYTATCSTDASGGDLSNTQAPSFADCAPLCDALSGCIGFAYANGFCYFKSSKSTFTSNSNVDVAFKPALSSSTTTSSSTSAPSTTAPSTTAPSTTAPSTTAPSTTAPSTTAPSTTAPSTTASSTTAPSTTAPSTTASSTTRSSSSSSSSAAPTTSSTKSATPTASSSTSAPATSTAGQVPTASIVNPVAPAGNDDGQCTLLRQAPQFKLSAVVVRGNRALNGLFLQMPSYTSTTSPPRLVSGATNGGQYVQTNLNNPFNVLPSIASVTSSGSCSAVGLALFTSSTEQGAVGLLPNIGTASTVDMATTVGYVFPFQLYQFGSFYACAAPGGATLRWVKNDASNFFGALYQTLDLTNCALVSLRKTLA